MRFLRFGPTLFLFLAASCSWGIELLQREGSGDGDGDGDFGSGGANTGGSLGLGGENLAGSSSGGQQSSCTPQDTTEWFEDADGDGAGDPDSSIFACVAPAGYVADGSDCAVLDGPDPDCNGRHGSVCSSMHEGPDVCDGADNNCDGEIDEDCDLPVIEGLLLWLDASDSSTYDAGLPIAAWHDKSGASHHAAQGESMKRPQPVESVLAGRSVVRFDGADDSLIVDNASGAFDAANLTVMYVMAPRWQALPEGNPCPFAIRGTHSGQTRISTHLNADLSSFMSFDGVQNVSSTVTFVPDEFHFLEFSVVAHNNSNHYLDGVLRSSFAHGLRESELLRPVRIGAAQDDLEHFEGDIAEVIVYGRTLSVAERDLIEAYIETKWGIEM